MEEQIPVVTNWGNTFTPPSQYRQNGNTAWCNEWNNVRHINTWCDVQSTVPMMHVDYTSEHGHYNQGMYADKLFCFLLVSHIVRGNFLRKCCI